MKKATSSEEQRSQAHGDSTTGKRKTATGVIPFDYQGQAVAFNADGWINATQAGAQFGKRPNDWLALPSTVEYLEALNRRTVTRLSGIGWVLVKRGGKNQGTWLDPKLAVKFARWLSVDFEIWCDEQIDGLLRGTHKPLATARREASIGYRAMCDALAISYQACGKVPQRHHFINEARLIGAVIADAFDGRTRDQLSASELELVTLVELRESVLIAQGMPFAERKANLLGCAQGLQVKRLGSDAA
jgi:hypothetical protein